MATTTILSEHEYRKLALTDPDRLWELWDGVPVEKPLMSVAHDGFAFFLGHLLQNQLDRSQYWVNVNGGKTRYTTRNYFIPDVVVIPIALVQPVLHDPRAFNAFAEPLPFAAGLFVAGGRFVQ